MLCEDTAERYQIEAFLSSNSVNILEDLEKMGTPGSRCQRIRQIGVHLSAQMHQEYIRIGTILTEPPLNTSKEPPPPKRTRKITAEPGRTRKEEGEGRGEELGWDL